MNRRDFLKITIASAVAAVAPIPASQAIDAIKLIVPESPVGESMLDALCSRIAYLAILDARALDIIGITPVKISRAGANSRTIIPDFSIEIRHESRMGPIVLLDADEKEILRYRDTRWNAEIAHPGEVATVMPLALEASMA